MSLATEGGHVGALSLSPVSATAGPEALLWSSESLLSSCLPPILIASHHVPACEELPSVLEQVWVSGQTHWRGTQPGLHSSDSRNGCLRPSDDSLLDTDLIYKPQNMNVNSVHTF